MAQNDDCKSASFSYPAFESLATIFMQRTFILIGLRPIRTLTSPLLGKPLGLALGAVGAYVASGILHEWGTFFATPYLRQNPGLPAYPSMLFFASQGVLMVLEMVFEHLSGRKARGWTGKIWAVVAIGVPASVMVEVSSTFGGWTTFNRDAD